VSVPWQVDGRVWVWLGRCPVCGGVMGEPDRAVMVSRDAGGSREVYSCVHCWARLRLEASAVANETLVNGELEAPYRFLEASQVKVATGWERFYDQAYGIRPEWQEEKVGVGKGRVRSGQSAQKIAMTTAKWSGGIWQRVSAIPGQWYRFEAWFYAWSSSEDDPDTSISAGNLHRMVGANPWGHWMDHYATLWGREVDLTRYNEWVRAEIVFQAWHSEISLFAWGFSEWGVKHNDLYIDDAGLEPIAVAIGVPEDPEPEPEPEPDPGKLPMVVEVDYTKIASMTAEATAQRVVELQKGFLAAGLLNWEEV